MSTTTTLPTLTAADAERLTREAVAYLRLIDAFRAEGVEPSWGIPSPEPESGCSAPTPDGVDDSPAVD